MKKSILTLTASVFIAGAILTSCNASAEKAENTENKVAETIKVNEEYIMDIENYRVATAGKIEANNQNIAEFKARIEQQKKEARADYKKKVAELEQKNTDMKKKMDDYKADGKEKWETFKAEFNLEMDVLSESFKDLTAKKS